MLPFTRDEFLAVFAAYNETVPAAQPIAYAVGMAIAAALFSKRSMVQRLAGVGLAAMWLWTGIVYHWMFFAPINGAAWLFGLLCVAEGAGLLWAATRPAPLVFEFERTVNGALGGALILYAAILYPLVGLLSGHAWTSMPAFGVTPCPVTLFTLGMLLFARPGRVLWAIPLLWTAVGGSAAISLGVVQDWALLLSGPAVLLVLLVQPVIRRGPLSEATAESSRSARGPRRLVRP